MSLWFIFSDHRKFNCYFSNSKLYWDIGLPSVRLSVTDFLLLLLLLVPVLAGKDCQSPLTESQMLQITIREETERQTARSCRAGENLLHSGFQIPQFSVHGSQQSLCHKEPARSKPVPKPLVGGFACPSWFFMV